MPKYNNQFKQSAKWLVSSANKQHIELTKEQQIELAYQQAEQFKQDAIMQEEKGLDL